MELPLLVLILVIPNDIDRLFWLGFRLDGHVEPILGDRALTVFGFLLSFVSSAALVWLFATSPLHGWSGSIYALALLDFRMFDLMPDRARNRALHPDVILMDMSIPWLDGLAAVRRIKAELLDTKSPY